MFLPSVLIAISFDESAATRKKSGEEVFAGYTFRVIFATPSPTRTSEDDDIDLPPMDGGVDDGATEESDNDDLDPVPADAGKDPFDDSTGEDDPVDDDEIDPFDEDGTAEDDAERVGDIDEEASFLEDRASGLLEPESMLTENDEQGVGEEDFGIGDDEAAAAIDGGEEGPQDADEELREEDLPSLDADDLGDGDESDFFDLEVAATPPFPWAEPRWESRTVASIGPVIAVVIHGAGAVAMGTEPPQLWRIEADRAELLLAEGAPREGWRALRSHRKTGEIVIATDAGNFLSRDGGRHFDQREPASRGEHRAEAASVSTPAMHLLDLEEDLKRRTVDLRGTKLSAAAVLDEAGSLVAALQSGMDAGAATWLVRISAAGAVETLGVVRGVVWDLAWDEPAACAWVASDDGITILAPPTT